MVTHKVFFFPVGQGFFFLHIVVHCVSLQIRAKCNARARIQKSETRQAVSRGRGAQRCDSRTRQRSAALRGANRRRGRCRPTPTCRQRRAGCGRAERRSTPRPRQRRAGCGRAERRSAPRSRRRCPGGQRLADGSWGHRLLGGRAGAGGRGQRARRHAAARGRRPALLLRAAGLGEDGRTAAWFLDKDSALSAGGH